MTINEIIREIMRNNNISLSTMGNALRKSDKITPLSSRDIAARLKNDNMTFDKAVEMLNVLGYKIVIFNDETGESFTADQRKKIKLL